MFKPQQAALLKEFAKHLPKEPSRPDCTAVTQESFAALFRPRTKRILDMNEGRSEWQEFTLTVNKLK